MLTRRSDANGAPSTELTNSKSPQTDSDTIQVRRPRNIKTQRASTPWKPSNPAHVITHLGTIGEHSLSLTSLSTSEKPQENIMNTPRRERHDMSQHTEVASSAVPRKLAPKPVEAQGGALNPVVVGSSPLSEINHLPERRNHRQIEPHQFMDRGYKQLYNYQLLRPALTPKPAHGSTFTGHQSHDIYRMMHAKTAATSRWEASGPNGRGGQTVPFEIQYPMSAQYLVRQSKTQGHMSLPYPQHYNYQAPVGRHSAALSQNEETLRKKAVQYIREFSRPSPRKRKLSNADPDETSASEFEQTKPAAQTSPIKSTSRINITIGLTASSPFPSTRPHLSGKLKVFHNQDSNFHITQLTKHTNLLTSLLHMYPQSNDQKGLREDIAMLVSVQNKLLASWIKSELNAARKRRKSNTDSAISVGSIDSRARAGIEARTAQNEAERTDQDDEMRRFFSAAAHLWQDGSGQGVADVFAAEAGSSPVASAEAGIARRSSEVEHSDD